MIMAKKIKSKNSFLNHGFIMPVLAIFLFVSVLLTIPVIARKVGDAIGVDENDVRFWGNAISSIVGGLLILGLAVAFSATLVVAVPLAIAGVALMGWGIYSINQEKVKMDVGK